MSALLEVENLTVDFPTEAGILHAVRGVSFALDRGETLCVVGESGCGKSLTALAIMDLLPREARRRIGALKFAGCDIAGSRAAIEALRGDRISMIFQEPMTCLNPVFTVGRQLTDVFRAHGKGTRKQAVERALYLLERVGIQNPQQRLRQYPHELSGGLRQRVMIAMALMCGPDLILADEPTTALDVTIQAELLHLLKELQREFGMGLILITHDLGVVSRIADRVIVMYAGEVVESGATAQVFGGEAHPYTEGLMRCLPSAADAIGGRLPTIRGVVPSLIGEMRECGFVERCDLAQGVCRSRIPLSAGADGHAIRCAVRANAG